MNLYGGTVDGKVKTRVWIHLSTGSGFEYQSKLQTFAGFWDEQKWLTGDFNGDGKDDLVNLYGGTIDGKVKTRVWMHLSTGSSFEYQSKLQTLAEFWDEQKWLTGDFNGDGKDDLVNLYGDKIPTGKIKTQVWMHLSTGSSFEYQSKFQQLESFWDKQEWLSGDFNGDGKDDLVNLSRKEPTVIEEPSDSEDTEDTVEPISRPRVVCSIRDIPDGYVITGYTRSRDCGQGFGLEDNAIITKRPGASEIICGNTRIPDGYVITGYTRKSNCGQTVGLQDNATIIKRPGASEIICGNTRVPNGYVIVGYTRSSNCQTGPGLEDNALMIKLPGTRETICGNTRVPDGYVVTGTTRSSNCNIGPRPSLDLSLIHI